VNLREHDTPNKSKTTFSNKKKSQTLLQPEQCFNLKLLYPL